MVAKKKKDMNWDDIGKAIGTKIDKSDIAEYSTWKKPIMIHKDSDGFFGRLLFIIGVLVVLNQMNIIPDLAWWVYFLLIAGFSLMKF